MRYFLQAKNYRMKRVTRSDKGVYLETLKEINGDFLNKKAIPFHIAPPNLAADNLLDWINWRSRFDNSYSIRVIA